MTQIDFVGEFIMFKLEWSDSSGKVETSYLSFG